MTYHWLLFDADGTLFDYDAAEAKALAATFADAGLSFRPAYTAVYRAINAELWAAFERGEITQPDLLLERFARTLDTLSLHTDVSAFANRYLHNLGHTTDLIDGALEIIPALAGSYRLFLITNGIPVVQRTRLSLSPLRPYFADVVISGEIGYAKPDPRIFDAAFQGMGNPDKTEVLIIGDSLSADMAGGAAYGIDTCWFNPNGTEPDPNVPLTYTIISLHELESLLTQ